MKKWKIIRLTMSIVFVVVFVVNAWLIIDYKLDERNAGKLYEEVISNVVTPVQPDAEIKTPITVNFETLKAENPDVVGWLYSADTPINYPVLKGSSNDQYLHTMLNGKYNKAGSLFADYRMKNSVEEAFNYIIYGHNMKNNTMFGTLTEYKKQNYYESHKELYLLTPEKSYLLKAYSGFVTKAGSEIIYKLDHNADTLERYMTMIKDRSTFKNELVYTKGQPVVTLSTCAYDYDDARYVLVCIAEEL